MSAAGRFVYAITAQDESSGTIGSINNALLGIGSTLNQLGPGFSSLGNIISGFATGGPIGAAAATVGELVNGLKACVEAAKSSEDVWNRLKVAVENSGVAWDAAKDKIKSFAEGLMNISRFTDEDVAGAVKKLMEYGMDLETAMKTIGATTDLATAKQIPLAEAATAVGKAFEGQEGILTRMGVVISDTTPKAERFSAAMGQITEKFGGAAQADIETYAGKWTQLTNKLTELAEKIGSGLIPILTKLADGLIFVVDKVTWFIEQVTNAAKALNDLWAAMSKGANDALKGIGDAVNAGGEAITNSFNSLYKTLVGQSIWPDMWDAMIDETKRGMGGIQDQIGLRLGSVELGFTGAGGAAGPSTTHVTVYSSVGTLGVGDRSEYERYINDLHRTIADAVRSR